VASAQPTEADVEVDPDGPPAVVPAAPANDDLKVDLAGTALGAAPAGGAPYSPGQLATTRAGATAASQAALDQSAAATRNIETAREARKPLVDRYTQLQQDRPQPPDLTAFKPRDAPTYTSDNPLQNFGSFATALGIMGGMLTRRPLTASLDAAAGAMEAMHSRNIEDYKLNVDQWRNQSKHLEDLMKWRTDAYKLTQDKFSGDEAGLMKQIELTALATKDDQMLAALRTGDAQIWHGMLTDQTAAVNNYQDRRLKMDEFFLRQQQAMDDPGVMMARENARRFKAGEPPMDLPEEQNFLRELNANRYGLGSRGGAMSGAAMRERQKIDDVAKAVRETNDALAAEGKPPLDTAGERAIREEVERSYRATNPTWDAEKVSLLNSWKAAFAAENGRPPTPDETQKKFVELDRHGAGAADTKWRSQKDVFDTLARERLATPGHAPELSAAEMIELQQKAAGAFSTQGAIDARSNQLFDTIKQQKLEETNQTELTPRQVAEIWRYVNSTRSTASKAPEAKWDPTKGFSQMPTFPGAPGAPAAAPVAPAIGPGAASAPAAPDAAPTVAAPTASAAPQTEAQQAGVRSIMPTANTDLTEATGAASYLGGHVNTIIGAFGGVAPFPEMQKATIALNDLQKRTMSLLQNEVGGKPSNYQLKLNESLTVSPAKFFSGDPEALDKFNQTYLNIMRQVDQTKAIIAAPEKATQKQVTDARVKRQALLGVAADYETVIGEYSMRAKGPKANAADFYRAKK